LLTIEEALDQYDTRNTDGVPQNDVAAIWVARGFYTPGVTSKLPANLAMYGGFDGSETRLGQRASLYGTAIDGETAASDYRVFESTGNDNLLLDGFQISNWSAPTGHGGAVSLVTCDNVVLRNVLFIGNETSEVSQGGGGALFVQVSTSVTLEDCTFANNSSTYGGGAVVFYACPWVTIRNCLFDSNSVEGPVPTATGHYGGALKIDDCNAHVSDSRFVANSVGPQGDPADNKPKYGGAVCAGGIGSLSLEQCVFAKNAVSDYDYNPDTVGGISSNGPYGGAVFSRITELSLLNCLFHENLLATAASAAVRTFSGSAVFAKTDNPTDRVHVTNCTFVNNYHTGDCANIQLAVDNWALGPGSEGVLNVVNVLTAYDAARLGEDTACANAEAGIGVWPGLGNVYVNRTCFARAMCNIGAMQYEDNDIADTFLGRTMWLDDPASDAIFEDWGLSNFHLNPSSPLVDWGTNFVDVDPATPGY
jgi:hypothetical protein